MRSFLAGLSAVLLLNACSDDGLGKKFVPNPTDQDGPQDEPSPIEAGLATRFFHTATYKPNVSPNDRGLIDDESQRSGHICIKVDEVKDTATEEYADASQTLVRARLRARGLDSQNDLYTSFDASPAAAADVDELLAALWLRDLTFSSSTHTYGTAKAEDFTTRIAPTPTGTIKNLLFFDTRSLLDESWLGWDDTSLASANNFSNALYTYFGAKGGPFFTGDDFSGRPTKNPSCAGTITCYTMVFVWRETSDLFADRLALLPDEMAAASDSVLHSLRLEYDQIGMLKIAEEYIVPDLDPSDEVPNSITACIDGEPCLQAMLDNSTEFSEPCEF